MSYIWDIVIGLAFIVYGFVFAYCSYKWEINSREEKKEDDK